MKRGAVTLVMALLCLVASPAAGLADDLIVLSEDWQLQSSAKVNEPGALISTTQFRPEGWYPTAVPTTVLAALVENEVYPDPYYGLNLEKVDGYRAGPWVVMPAESPFRSPWWYRTEFTVPSNLRGRRLTLHFDGINYQADIWLNGTKIADRESVIGMFQRFEFDVTERVLVGERNVLAVEIIAPGQGPAEEWSFAAKQIEATIGWDDHNPQPPDMSMGIWRQVYLRPSGPARVKHPYVVTKLNLPSTDVASLTVSAEIANLTPRPVTGELRGTIENLGFSQPVRLQPNETRRVEFAPADYRQLVIQNPRVWWPHTVGSQELYELRLELVIDGRTSDSADVRFGIREATSFINEEGWRAYMINGKRILIRGGAWMVNDMLLRLSPDRYEAMIRYVRDAGLNMLRVEGFSVRETDEFYRLADEYGVMVTQQLFGRSIPDEALQIANVRDTILRIRNYPSLVHFLGHDETFPSASLDEAYRDLIAELTPERSYQPHSGVFNVKLRWDGGGARTGSREAWTYAAPEHYYVVKEVGAWGFAQSGGIGGVVASLESMRRMMPEGEMWPPWTKTWSHHTVIQGGPYFDALLKAMKDRYGEPEGIEDFTVKGQALNYESARGMFEAYARNKYYATGITTWKFNSAWPASPTWQYVDWYLVPTAAYFGAKKACEPLHVQYSYDDDSVWVVNSFYRDYRDLKVTAKLYNFDMTEKYSHTDSIHVVSDGKTEAFKIEWPAGLTRTHFLKLELHDNEGRFIGDNFYWLSNVPDIRGPLGYTKDRVFQVNAKSRANFTDLAKLPRVNLNVSSRMEERGKERAMLVTVANPSNDLAFMVRLGVTQGRGGRDVAPAYWEDNFFSLMPGESRVVRVEFAAEDLAGTEPVLRVDGWNIEPVVLASSQGAE
jgi:exo-1,4-beta-D-glucosaminidase